MQVDLSKLSNLKTGAAIVVASLIFTGSDRFWDFMTTFSDNKTETVLIKQLTTLQESNILLNMEVQKLRQEVESLRATCKQEEVNDD